jgi:hypothetical protein
MTAFWKSLSFCLLGVVMTRAQLSNAPNGQTKPNFSGTWKLNMQRSGPVMPRGLEALTLIVDHRDPIIHTAETRTVDGKVTKGSTEERIDGRERVTQARPEKTVRQTQRWSGNEVLKIWRMTEDGIEYRSDIRMTLSLDGKTNIIRSQAWSESGIGCLRGSSF